MPKTTLLDFHHPSIQAVIKRWHHLSPFDQVGAAYDFVRNDILFGYNSRDDLPASAVLADGYGQCNTKGTLLMALLLALEIPCRLHGFTIEKQLQRGVVPALIYPITPENILHSWVEVQVDDTWIKLEGFILDEAFLGQLQAVFSDQSDTLCGYGVGTLNLSNPGVEWTGADTFIQKTGINQDFGIFETPDAFYAQHQQDLSAWKRVLYTVGIRHWMNARVRRIRSRGTLPVW